jgi:hypothetical protein
MSPLCPNGQLVEKGCPDAVPLAVSVPQTFCNMKRDVATAYRVLA